ncbi:hypothetical protein BDV10DRAFT_157136 [Aspergillus recurvatus]
MYNVRFLFTSPSTSSCSHPSPGHSHTRYAIVWMLLLYSRVLLYFGVLSPGCLLMEPTHMKEAKRTTDLGIVVIRALRDVVSTLVWYLSRVIRLFSLDIFVLYRMSRYLCSSFAVVVCMHRENVDMNSRPKSE